MSKWTRTTPITALEAEAEPERDRIFGSSYEARQARQRPQREVTLDRDPWKKPKIVRSKEAKGESV
jgi:hypothetical protein